MASGCIFYDSPQKIKIGDSMSSVTYSNWAAQWLTRKEQLVKESTFSAYSNIVVNHLVPHFGRVGLQDITEERIQSFAFHLLRDGRLDGAGGMCERSTRDIIVVLKNSLRDAMKLKLLPSVEFEIQYPNKQDRFKIKVIAKSEQQKLVQAVYLALSPRSVGIMLALYTGLRIGEVCGLKWSDIDFENKMLNVNRTVQRVYRKTLDGKGKSQIIVGPPKTRSSRREIPISAILLPVLKRIAPETSDVFFLSGTEKCVEVRTYRTFFDDFLKKNQLENINFHALRHTFATRCIEAGGDCKTVSELLGHSSVNMTLNLYVHPQIEQKRRCVELLSEIF